MQRFLLTGDAARRVGRTPATIRAAAIAGRIRVAAVTEGGVRLFTPEAIEEYKRAARERAADRRKGEAA